MKLGKDLKYINRFKDTPKESQTDRRIEYGKLAHGLKGSFKTNRISNNAKNLDHASNQMLNNIYKKKSHKNYNKDNYKSNSILENFNRNKQIDNISKNKKKNFVVASGSNDQSVNNKFAYNKGNIDLFYI